MTATLETSPALDHYLTYLGDVAETIIGQRVGPTRDGEYLTAVSADYDEHSGRTRVRFTVTAHIAELVAPPEGLVRRNSEAWWRNVSQPVQTIASLIAQMRAAAPGIDLSHLDGLADQ